jgi:hypothetical protein
MIAFTVTSEPVGTPRPRAAVGGGSLLTHETVTYGVTRLRSCWRSVTRSPRALGEWKPLLGPLSVIVGVFLCLPASIPKRDRLTARPRQVRQACP